MLIVRSDGKWVRVSLFFFTDFYISNESPDLRVRFAKRISPNGAELPKLCVYQVSDLAGVNGLIILLRKFMTNAISHQTVFF